MNVSQTMARLAIAAALAAPAALHAQSVTIFGSPANFDAMNATGQDVHGFEIELQGITPADISYVWPSSRFPYKIVTTATGVIIHYASPYVNGQYTITTIPPAAFNPTFGHSCVLGAIPGCEHFGYLLAYYGNKPTQTINRWLVDDPQNPGNLIAFGGANVQVPVPTVNIVPPPQPGAPPAVAFQIEAPKPPNPELQFGEAKWVKVLKNQVQKAVAVDDLLEDNPVVPNDANPAQVETAWKLLQHNPHSANSGVLRNQSNVQNGDRAIVRKYEFYKFSGKYDPVDHGAICADVVCNAPSAGELGDYIGTQMAAANVGVPALTVVRSGSGTVTGASGKINCGGACSTPLPIGTAVTLTASVPGNAIFGGWSGDCVSNQLSCSFVISGDNTVTATFTTIFTLSVGRSGSGTVVATPAGTDRVLNCGGACSAKFPSGTTVTLTATPAAGQPFSGWSGACAGVTANVCNVVISKDTAVQANFK